MENFKLSLFAKIRSCPAKHCFISLPQSSLGFVTSSQIPTFILEKNDGKRLVVSWAGEIHSEKIDNDHEYEEVWLSAGLLKRSDISDGDYVIVKQVNTPPSCTSVQAQVNSIEDWQNLILNSEIAQNAFLDQIRIVSLEQIIPLWLEGGACISLKIKNIVPSYPHAVLQSMTQVEVIPPSDDKDESEHKIFKINTSPEAPPDVKCSEDSIPSFISTKTDDMVGMFLKNLFLKSMRLNTKTLLPPQKDFFFGSRVIPVPEIPNSNLCRIFMKHPSLCIIRKKFVKKTHLENDVSFIANLSKVPYKLENFDTKPVDKETSKESNQTSETVVVKSFSKKFQCVILVWENFLSKNCLNNTDKDFIEKMNEHLFGNYCVLSKPVRRTLSLLSMSVVEICISDCELREAPVCCDIIATQGVCINLEHDFKTYINDMCYLFDIVLNNECIVDIASNLNENNDVYLSLREKTPLVITKKSILLLNVTIVSKDISSLPYFPSITDNNNMPLKKCYIGNSKLNDDLVSDILFYLGFKTNSSICIPQFLLLEGGKTSGKTTLIENVVDVVSSAPYFVHCEIIALKLLKGKKVESIEKRIKEAFELAMFHSPSLIVLDDLDILYPSFNSGDEETGPVYEYGMQMVTVLIDILHQLMFYLEKYPINKNNGDKINNLMVIATCTSRVNVNAHLVSPKGYHLFPRTMSIPPLNSTQRVDGLKKLLHQYFNAYYLSKVCQQNQDLEFNSNQIDDDEITNSTSFLDLTNLSKSMEGYQLADISSLSLRVFIEAKCHWDKEIEEKLELNLKNKNKKLKKESSSSSLAMEDHQLLPEAVIDQTIFGKLYYTNEDFDKAVDGFIPTSLKG